ncbi:hypothetical protein GF319_03990 [Candidatus Bathyarchaeota archaeon]|nr:hypothetical protein [Candidatus Bathyarchaeota archaeon]
MTIIPVTIVELENATPTIKYLKLDLSDHDFEYKAGQWIDCYADINGERHIVGYSIASNPLDKGFIELAVKKSDNTISNWIHEKANLNDTLHIDGGQGEIFYTREMSENIVLLAAGIGIASIRGILHYANSIGNIRANLVYSASTPEELAFHREFQRISNKNKLIKYHPTVTKAMGSGLNQGRIDKKLLDSLNLENDSLYYISGPPEMISDVISDLKDLRIEEEKIKFELWW